MSEFFRPGHVVKLAPYSSEHAEKFSEWYYDYEYRFFFRDFSQALSLDGLRTLGTKMASTGSHLLVITDKATDEPIGVMTYSLEKSAAKIYKFGIMMASSNQHKTLAIEAIIILGDFLFIRKNCHKLFVEFSDKDTHIHRITAKGGFVLEATLKEEIFVDGEYYDEARYAIYESVYRELYGTYLDGVADSNQDVGKS